MGGIYLPDQHLTFSSKGVIREICKPLTENTGIDYFYYARLYRNNDFIRLGTHIKWHKFCLENPEKIFSNQEHYFRKNLLSMKEFTFIEKEPKAANLAKELFDIRSFICLIKRRENYVEEFGFATHKTKNLFGFYLSHPDLLLQFSLYFTDKARDLILKSEQSYRISVPVDMGFQATNSKFQKGSADMSCLDALKHEISVKRYYLSDNQYLSPQEFACIKMLVQGNSMKSISKHLGISVATVRDYVCRAKNRCNFVSTRELLDSFLTSKLHYL